MLIDWFTVVAQVINFLILAWLMKRFLYQPILHAIDRRESRIAAELADADARKAEARDERNEFQRKNQELDDERASLMAKALEEAGAERQRLIEESRQEAATLDARRRTALESEAKALGQTLARRAQQEVFAIAGQVLTDLAGASLEERATEVFTRRLRDLDERTKTELVNAISRSSARGQIRSAFPLTQDQRTSIQHALNETFSVDLQLDFTTAPELVSGIEFTSQGRKVAWSIDDYLRSLQDGAAELLAQHAETEAAR